MVYNLIYIIKYFYYIVIGYEERMKEILEENAKLHP